MISLLKEVLKSQENMMKYYCFQVFSLNCDGQIITNSARLCIYLYE
jgi:hypothetical protein